MLDLSIVHTLNRFGVLINGIVSLTALSTCPSTTQVMDMNLMPSKHEMWSPFGGVVSSNLLVFEYKLKLTKNFS